MQLMPAHTKGHRAELEKRSMEDFLFGLGLEGASGRIAIAMLHQIGIPFRAKYNDAKYNDDQ